MSHFFSGFEVSESLEKKTGILRGRLLEISRGKPASSEEFAALEAAILRAGDVVEAVVEKAGDVVEKAGDVAEAVVEKAGDVVEKVGDMMERAEAAALEIVRSLRADGRVDLSGVTKGLGWKRGDRVVIRVVDGQIVIGRQAGEAG